MSFDPVEYDTAFVGFIRFDVGEKVCMIVLDGARTDIEERYLVRALDGAGVNLAEFWNHYGALA
jgi:hypothetical protein